MIMLIFILRGTSKYHILINKKVDKSNVDNENVILYIINNSEKKFKEKEKIKCYDFYVIKKNNTNLK